MNDTKEYPISSMHIGRTWPPDHSIEDECPCPKESCGLIDERNIDPNCPEHSIQAGKTMRQRHLAYECSNDIHEYETKVLIPKIMSEE